MITKNTRIIPELAFLYLRPERLQMESYISRNIEGTYNVTFQLKACVTFFFFFGISCNRAIKKKKNLPCDPARRGLGSSVRPGGPWLSLKLQESSTVAGAGAGPGSNCSQSRLEIIRSQPPRRNCGLELLWRFEK